MRCTTLALIVTLLQWRTPGYTQITLKEKNAPLEKVLSAIEKQTRYVFLYDPDILKISLITIEIKDASIHETLGKIFNNTPIEYIIIGNNILLKRKKTFKIYDHAAKRRKDQDKNGDSNK